MKCDDCWLHCSQREKSPELPESGILTTAELHGNASAFTVFATVRQSVLVQGIRDASRLYHLANNGADSDSESDEDADEKSKDATIKIPKVLVDEKKKSETEMHRNGWTWRYGC